MRRQHSTYDITQTVPQAIGVINLTIYHKDDKRKGGGKEYNKALDDVGRNYIQLH
jgi:hypothetical protein